MKILVTGHEGFVGSHVFKRLSGNEDWKVRGLDRTTTVYNEWRYGALDTLCDKWDAVVLIGAISSNYYNNFDITLWNTEAPRMLAERAWRFNDDCHVIFFSSSMVPLTKDNREQSTPYSWSKELAEHLIKAHQEWGSRRQLTIFRPCIIWGDERGFPRGGRSVPFQMANHELRHLWKGRVRTHIHVDDVARAVEKAIAGRITGTYNLITDDHVTNDEIAGLLNWDGFKLVDPPAGTWLDQYAHLSEYELQVYNHARFDIQATRSVKVDMPLLEKALNNEH